jgi:hypothetical protein
MFRCPQGFVMLHVAIKILVCNNAYSQFYKLQFKSYKPQTNTRFLRKNLFVCIKMCQYLLFNCI